MVSYAWKSLTDQQRAPWYQMVAQDKIRFDYEKSNYTGRWKAPKNERPPKDPAAPKRPITVFLEFSNHYRELVKKQNPGMKTTIISKILANMWRRAPREVRLFYLEKDRQQRQQYNIAMAAYNSKKVLQCEDRLILSGILQSQTTFYGSEVVHDKTNCRGSSSVEEQNKFLRANPPFIRIDNSRSSPKACYDLHDLGNVEGEIKEKLEVSQMRDDLSLNKSEYSRVNTPILFERMSSKELNIAYDEISSGDPFLLPENQRRGFPSIVGEGF
jgi:cell wall assembly regulator SMI1